MWLGEGSRHLSPLGAQAGLADWSVSRVGVQVAWSGLALPPVTRNRIFFFFFLGSRDSLEKNLSIFCS